MHDSVWFRDLLGDVVADRDRGAEVLGRLCAAAKARLPVDGVTVTTPGDAGRAGIVAASDLPAGRLGDLQVTLDEGPGRDAARSGRPALLSDLAGPVGSRWPLLRVAAAPTGVRGMFALPMLVGLSRLGVLELFRFAPGPLAAEALARALNASKAAGFVAVQTLPDQPGAVPQDALWRSRIDVHRAVGLIMVQRGVTSVEAVAQLRAHAFGHDLAQHLVAGELRLDRAGTQPGNQASNRRRP
ncbi:GAF and ANTAR domain-containing protein [Frankia sp. KB5]|uniref:GAF and ANTAR domain-containing protein n=1 Tax=Frankia sp. KB5 TaxID=683318 RepID=UPI000A109795|nr:GAF and ANTAR domain-containing protein [Frankia sp. KB5]ORT47441.1 hypothetical protein KBI5_19695 [Frankia sp. KB5]